MTTFAVSTTQLEALVATHRALLDGEPDPSLAGLGDLDVVLVGRDGWRRDGLVRSTRFIAALVNQYLDREIRTKTVVPASGDVAAGTAAAVTPERLRIALDAALGLTAFPLGIVAAGKRADPPIPGQTLTDHLGRVLSTAVDQGAAARLLTSFVEVGAEARPPRARSTALGPRDPFPLDAPAGWPTVAHLDDWQQLSNLGDAWFQGVLQARSNSKDEVRREFGDIARTLIGIELARTHISPANAANSPGRRLRERHLLHGVLDEWRRSSLGGIPRFSAMEPVVRRDDRARRSVAVAVERAGYTLFADEMRVADVIRLAADRSDVRRFIADTIARAPSGFDTAVPTAVVRLITAPAPAGRPRTGLTTRQVEAAALLERFRGLSTVLVNPQDALAFSEYIHAAASDARLSVPLIRQYLAKREMVRRSGLLRPGRDYIASDGTRVDHATAVDAFALADVNVHLRMTDHRMDDERVHLTAIMKEMGPDYGFAALAGRDDALAASKHDRHLTAIRTIDEQSRLDDSVGNPAYTDRLRELLETQHQVSLAAAAICVKYVENQLFVARHRNQLHEKWFAGFLNAALIRSERTADLLRRLELSIPGGLPLVRSDDAKHIGWRGWWVTTLQTRLRSLLAARTAIDAGLIDSAQVVGGRVDLAEVRSVYRAMISHPGLTEAGPLRIAGMQGTWLAMMQGGSLPVVFDLDNGVPSALAFLDVDPLTIADDDAEPVRMIDVDGSARWHRANGDLGNLGRLAYRGAVWRTLEQRSGDALTRWFDLATSAD